MQAEFAGRDAPFARRLHRHAHGRARRALLRAARRALRRRASSRPRRWRTARGRGGGRRGALDRLAPVDAPDRLMLVDDARLALGRLGAYWRGRFANPLLALTGSNGKTTVKEMIAAILASPPAARSACSRPSAISTTTSACRSRCCASRRQHRYAVVEMGMNHAGEIRYLSTLASPDVALVNNAGTAHLENLGSRGGDRAGERARSSRASSPTAPR